MGKPLKTYRNYFRKKTNNQLINSKGKIKQKNIIN